MIRVSIIFIFILGLVNTCYATNVAVIDLDKVLKQYPLVKQIDDKLHAQFSPKNSTIEQQRKKLTEKIDNLKRNGSVMTKAQRDNLQIEISTEKKDLQLEQAHFNQDLQAAQKQAMQHILNNINNAVVRVAKKNKYQVVLQKSKTIYIDDSIDISSKVLVILKKGTQKKLEGLAAALNKEE
jgi:outer membrane protein